jgi:hypothetical protein
VLLVDLHTVRRLDLTSGRERLLARLPGRIVAAERLGDRLYLGSPEAHALFVPDTSTGLRRPDRLLPGPPIRLAPARR